MTPAPQPLPDPAPVRAEPACTEPVRAESACTADVCITCSDVAVEVTIVRLLVDGMAVVDTESGPEEVSVALVPAGVGDVVLVHAGEAIAVMPR